MKPRCQNFNHGRSNPPVRYCPDCGEQVNPIIHKDCSLNEHGRQRKSFYKFCVHCGEALVK